MRHLSQRLNLDTQVFLRPFQVNAQLRWIYPDSIALHAFKHAGLRQNDSPGLG